MLKVIRLLGRGRHGLESKFRNLRWGGVGWVHVTQDMFLWPQWRTFRFLWQLLDWISLVFEGVCVKQLVASSSTSYSYFCSVCGEEGSQKPHHFVLQYHFDYCSEVKLSSWAGVWITMLFSLFSLSFFFPPLFFFVLPTFELWNGDRIFSLDSIFLSMSLHQHVACVFLPGVIWWERLNTL